MCSSDLVRPGGPFGGQQPPDLDKMISQAQQFIRNLLGGGSNGGGRPPSGDGEGFGGFLLSGRGLSLLGLLVAVVWMASGIYRVQPDGLWDEMWTLKDDAPYDVAIENDGALLVATGPKGKLFRVSGNPVNPVLLTRVPAQQATTLARIADRTVIATANPGMLMQLSATRATKGTSASAQARTTPCTSSALAGRTTTAGVARQPVRPSQS